MSTFQVIVLIILFNGYCCKEKYAKVGSLFGGQLHLVISTKLNWQIETYVYAPNLPLQMNSSSFIRNQHNYYDKDSINLTFYCEYADNFDSKTIFQSMISHCTTDCWRNKQQIWKNIQTSFDEFEDLAIYYTCTREEGSKGPRNISVLMLIQNKDSNQSNEVINYKINTAIVNDYPQIEIKIDRFYEISNNIEFQKYLVNIGCGHLVKLDFNLIPHVHNFSNSAIIILILISVLLLLGIGFCCYDNLRIKV